MIPTLFFSLIESLFILPKHLSHLRRVDNIEEGKGFVGAGAVFSTGSSQGWINSSFESTNPASVGVSSGVT